MASYAKPADLAKFGAPAAALDGIDPSDLQDQLDAASALADSYLRNHYTLPIATPYPLVLVEQVCRIAAYNALSVRGYNPEGDASALETRYRAAMKWLEDVGAGRASPPLQDSSPTSAGVGGPFVVQPRYDSDSGAVVVSRPLPRGW